MYMRIYIYSQGYEDKKKRRVTLNGKTQQCNVYEIFSSPQNLANLSFLESLSE